jgi:hypothetical protein
MKQRCRPGRAMQVPCDPNADGVGAEATDVAFLGNLSAKPLGGWHAAEALRGRNVAAAGRPSFGVRKRCLTPAKASHKDRPLLADPPRKVAGG